MAQELHRLKEKNAELKRQQEKTSKELAVTKQQLDSARSQLHAAERAQATTQQYVHNVEHRLALSGKGPTVVKAAKLQSDVEWLEKENSVLFGDLHTKAKEAEELKLELHKQRKLVDQVAAGLRLPSSAVLDELHDLRAQVIQLSDALAEKEDTIKRHAADQKDMQVFQGFCSTLASRTADLETRAKASEAQCAELLDFIEEKQGGEASLAAERDAASLDTKELKRELRQAQKANLELQDVLRQSQAEQKALQMKQSGKKLEEADARRHTTELQVLAAGAQKQLDFVDRELRVLLKSLHEALGSSRPPSDQDLAPSLTTMDTLAHGSPEPPSRPAEVVGLLAQVSQNLKLMLARHADLQKAADHHQHLARQNTQLWDQLSTLEPQHVHACALVADLQAQVTTSAANWKQLVQALIDHFDPTNIHACVAGREYEAASAVVAHLKRVSHAHERSKEQILQQEGMVAALRKELTECQDELAVARRVCVLRPCPEEYEAALQEQHQAKSQMVGLKDRISASEAQARQFSHQMLELQATLQAREQQMKALQQENAEQEQELLTLRTLRAVILMHKGCKGLPEQQSSPSMSSTAQPTLYPDSPLPPSSPFHYGMLNHACSQQQPQQRQPALLGHAAQRHPPTSQQHHRPSPLMHSCVSPSHQRTSRRHSRMHVLYPPGFPGLRDSSPSSSESSPAAHSPPPPARSSAPDPGRKGYTTAAGAFGITPLQMSANKRRSRGIKPAAVQGPSGYAIRALPLRRRAHSSSGDDGDGQEESFLFGRRRCCNAQGGGRSPGKPPRPPPPPVPCKHPSSDDDDYDDDDDLEVKGHGRCGKSSTAAPPVGRSLEKGRNRLPQPPLPQKVALSSGNGNDDDDNDDDDDDDDVDFKGFTSRSMRA
ncbi:hypothetical protein DUNSADRAFT_14693 [Dunaliella salina]|uniref:Uncharacterized protein n=1 Tax=Dunaliella salina TaxID=3046 RepID=A0ABQ7G6X8_DUNSA|nr:hypothetical protein DUNSADRAFT_14693 [Dunaliella salina]|eukprot:KAF5830353.1 hypothetical protein DUNSADRAFT_14693 [Dunaliella salina]